MYFFFLWWKVRLRRRWSCHQLHDQRKKRTERNHWKERDGSITNFQNHLMCRLNMHHSSVRCRSATLDATTSFLRCHNQFRDQKNYKQQGTRQTRSDSEHQKAQTQGHGTSEYGCPPFKIRMKNWCNGTISPLDCLRKKISILCHQHLLQKNLSKSCQPFGPRWGQNYSPVRRAGRFLTLARIPPKTSNVLESPRKDKSLKAMNWSFVPMLPYLPNNH